MGFSSTLITLLLTITLVSCQQNNYEKITVIATSTPHGEILEIAKPLLKERGYQLEIIITSDYFLPNPSVVNKDAVLTFFNTYHF